MSEIDCVFCQIRDKKIEAEFLYEDDVVMAFADLHPKKPIHILIVPKMHVPHLLVLDDDKVLNHVTKAIKKLANDFGIETNGFKVEINGGGLQDIDHLHVHLTGPYGKS